MSSRRAAASSATVSEVPDGVDHRRAILAGGHQPGTSQDRQLLREVGGLDAHEGLQVPHRPLALDEHLQDPDARWMGERTEQVGLHLRERPTPDGGNH